MPKFLQVIWSLVSLSFMVTAPFMVISFSFFLLLMLFGPTPFDWTHFLWTVGFLVLFVYLTFKK